MNGLGSLLKMYSMDARSRPMLLLGLCTLTILLVCVNITCGSPQVFTAINCGGQEHVDVHGVHYEEDSNHIGTPSDHGKNLNIQRVPLQDAILYQTERYHTDTFSYTIPIEEDGEYVLVLKFSEVWFVATSEKVFDIVLNEQHLVVQALDIFEEVGLGMAHDEVVPFTIAKGKLKVKSETSTFDGDLLIEFVKGEYDNPKVNAIVVWKANVNEIPSLPPLSWSSDNDADDADIAEDDGEDSSDDIQEQKKVKHKSGPKTIDPYASDESSLIFPILIAIAVFIPTLFCLCRL